MPKYKVFVSEEFDQQLNKFPKKDKAIIEKKLAEYVYPQLKTEPHFGSNIKKLRNYKPPTWRYRIGKYRIFFIIDADNLEVNVLTIYLRRDAY